MFKIPMCHFVRLFKTLLKNFLKSGVFCELTVAVASGCLVLTVCLVLPDLHLLVLVIVVLLLASFLATTHTFFLNKLLQKKEVNLLS